MPLTVGTAGHIDHGKTWLVRALTGKDTDRLPEEQERGISIDLGYAPLELPDGRRLSVVDVPGHERFVRNMVAGATGIDLFLLVIDAAEGARPQTHEHLAILRLLGIDTGVVAVTKADAVDEETLELALEEARELVPGAEVVAVSAKTGSGLDELRAALADAARERSHADGPTRLYVDRVFTLRGIGTVATGTLWSGSIGEGDELRAEPAGLAVRVRSVQVHDHPVERAEAGQRVAVALPGTDRAELRRGDALVTPGAFRPSYRLDVALEAPAEIPPRVQVHHGTSQVVARLARTGDGYAQLRLAEPVVAARGDRLGETELRISIARPRQAGDDLARPVVYLDARGDLGGRFQRDVEPVARPEGPGRDERVTATQLGAVGARQGDGNPLTRLRPLDRMVVDLDAPDADGEPGRLGPELVPLADRPAPECSGGDGSDAAQREDAVDVEAGRAVRVAALARGVRECRAQLVQPGAGLGAHGHDLGARHELTRLLERELERLFVDGVRLRHGDDAVLDPEQADDREMLMRLRPGALAGVDHEQEEVDPGCAGNHVVDEALVAGDVDDREPAPVRQVERRVAEVDRDPARFLFRQPVGVLAGQRPDEPRLAVVDVACRSDGQWHSRSHSSGSSGNSQDGSGRHSGQGSQKGGSSRSARLTTSRPSARMRSAIARSKRSRSTKTSSSPSSFQRQVRSGSMTTSSARSIVSNPSSVRRNGSWRLTYQPKCSPLGSHETRNACQSPSRISDRIETSHSISRKTQSPRAAHSARRIPRSPLCSRVGGVVGAFQRVPRGIHSATKSPSSRTTRIGRAAHTRSRQTSWRTIVSPGDRVTGAA